jgi:hypothetical protein
LLRSTSMKSCYCAPNDLCFRDENRRVDPRVLAAHQQPEAVMVDFVNP